MKSLKSVLFTILYLTTYLVSGIIVPIGIYGSYMIYFFIKNRGNSEYNFNELNNNAVTFLSKNSIIITFFISIFTFILFLLIQKIRKENLIQKCKFKRISIYNILFCIFLGITLNFLIDVLLKYLSALEQITPYMKNYQNLMESIITNSNFLITLFVVGLFAPVFEEIMLRGLIQNELKKGINIYLAILIQALLFGIIHANLIQSSYAFIIGILIGFTYYLSDSIWSPIIIHLTINLQSTILSSKLIESHYLKLLNISHYTDLIIILVCFSLSIMLAIKLFNKNEFSFTKNNQRE